MKTCLHGHPHPHEAIAGRWPAPWHKRPYKHTRPVWWLHAYWAE